MRGSSSSEEIAPVRQAIGGSAPLDYAPRPPMRRRQWFRSILMTIVCVLLIAVGIKIGPATYRMLLLQQAWSNCLQHVAPSRQLVCAEPARWGGATPPFVFAAKDPPSLTQIGPMSIGSTPPVGPIIFMHERVTAAGRHFLVVLRRTPPNARMSWDVPLGFNVTVIDATSPPPTPIAKSFWLLEVLPEHFNADPSAVPPLRIFAGQPDDRDAASFFFEYELEGRRGIVDGRLLDNPDRYGPTLVLRER